MEKTTNRKYKIFGINIIDLFAVLVLVAAVAFVGLKLSGFGKPEGQMYQMTYTLDEVSSFVTDHLEENCRLYDHTQDKDLGRCTGFTTAPGISYGANANGEYVKSSREGYVSLVLTGEVEGVQGKNGVVVGKYEYCVGDMIILRAGDAKLYIRVSDIKPIGE